MLEAVSEELGWENPEVVKQFKGQQADRVIAKHPFYDRDSIVMLGNMLQLMQVLAVFILRLDMGKMTSLFLKSMD